MNKYEKTLPKNFEVLPGAVCRQMVRCGYAGCRCARGKLHGPYYYRFWREDGRLRKTYVPLREVIPVREACIRHRESVRNLRLMIKESRSNWRQLRNTLREIAQDG